LANLRERHAWTLASPHAHGRRRGFELPIGTQVKRDTNTGRIHEHQ
jgi:hypothetical protein